jgi:hypothetical protein
MIPHGTIIGYGVRGKFEVQSDTRYNFAHISLICGPIISKPSANER